MKDYLYTFSKAVHLQYHLLPNSRQNNYAEHKHD